MYARWARCARRYSIARPAAIVLCQNDSEPRRVPRKNYTAHLLRTSRSLPTTTQANMIKSDEEANEIFQKAHEKDEKGDHKGYLEDILRFLNTRKQAIKSGQAWLLRMLVLPTILSEIMKKP